MWGFRRDMSGVLYFLLLENNGAGYYMILMGSSYCAAGAPYVEYVSALFMFELFRLVFFQ